MREISRLIELGLILILLMAGTGASQEDPAADFTYTSSGTAITITGYVGPGGDVTIPSTIEGLPVTRIGGDAFQHCTALTSVTIPDSVTSIGGSAFSRCDSLTSVTIPDSVTSVGEWAFSGCTSLTSMTIGDGVTSMDNGAFSDCTSLTSVTISSGVTIIGDHAFSGCTSLPSVIIPDSVTSIGRYAFEGCTSMTSMTIGGGVTNIGDYAFLGCDSLTSVVIPDSVTSIGNGAFISCTSLTSVTIPDSVTTIGEWAFASCFSLTSMDIGNGITSIGRSTFQNCSSLNSVTIGSGVTSIGYHAFYRCYSLTSVTIPDSVTSIGNEAFYRCISLTSVTIPDSVTSIGNEAFAHCYSLTSVNIGSGVTSIGSNAFSLTSLTSVTIPESVTSIADTAFSACTSLTTIEVDPRNTAYASVDGVLYDKTITMLLQCPQGKTSVTIPDSVTSIADEAFSGCDSLTSVTIPDSVTSVGEWAFSGCTSLTSVTIGNGVTSIGDSAFSGCTSLTAIEVDPRNTAYSSVDGVLYDKAITTLLQCPEGKTRVVIPDSVTSIADEAFFGRDSLTSVTIPDSVTSIGERAFSGCTSLTSVTIPDSVTSIGRYAFSYCTTLTSAPIGSGVTSIGDYAFFRCDSLSSVIIPDSVTSIGESAFAYCFSLNSMAIGNGITNIGRSTFQNCSSMISITIPDSVTSIGSGAFRYCTSLTSVTIPNSVTSIDEWAFFSCTSLNSVTIGSGVTSIGYQSFLGCISLTSVVIPNSVTSIDEWAFYRCTSLTSVTIPESVTSIGDSAFSGCTSLTTIEVDPRNIAYASVDGVLYDKTITMLLQCPQGKTSVTIPDSVTSIGDSAFHGCTSLTSVTIPESVTSISSNAFAYCTSLTSVVIPKSVTSISSDAFAGCTSLTSVVIPKSVTSIGQRAFYRCTSLTSVTIPNSVTSIGERAFSGCTSLALLTIPDSVTSIGTGALSDCTALTLVTIPGSVTRIEDSVFEGCTSLTSVTIPDSVSSIDIRAFRGCISLTSVIIPDSVTSIDYEAFAWCSALTSMTFEGNAPSLGIRWAQNVPKTMVVYYHPGARGFATPIWKGFPCYPIGEALIAVSKTANVTEAGVGDVVGYSIWVNNTGDVALTNITAYDNLTAHMENIGSLAPGGSLSFNQSYQVTGSDIGKVIVNNVTANGTTPSGALVGSFDTASVEAIAAIVVPVANFTANVTSGEAPLTVQFTDLSTNNPTSWAWDFENDSAVDSTDQSPIYTYNAAGSYTVRLVVNNSAGSDDEVKTDFIVVKEALPFTYTSDGSAITITGYTGPGGDVIIPGEIEGLPVTSIAAYAFNGCTSLTSLTIGSRVASIGDGGFDGCTSLTTIEVDPRNTAYASVDGVLYDKAITTLLQCPGGKTSVVIPDSVTSIADEAFLGCPVLTSVAIPDSVTIIGNFAFRGCTSLTSVIIGSGVTSIGSNAFHDCTSLTSVTIPDSVVSMGLNAFCSCTALTSVTIGNGVTRISSSTFSGCTSLTSVIIGSGVTHIDWLAFANCTSLTSVIIPDSVTSIGRWAFVYCTSLTSVTLPYGVTSIEGYAFSGCDALTSVTIPDSVTSIGGSAFSGCDALTSVTIPDSVTSIGGSAFAYCTSLTTIKVDPRNTAYASVDGVLYDKAITTLLQCPGGKISVTIPDSVTTIGNSAFDDCTSLTSVTFEGNAPTLGMNWAQNVPRTMVVYYHPGATGFTTPTWNGFPCYPIGEASIAVSKKANVTEAGLGTVIGYSIVVNNTGNVSLTGVLAYDNLTDHLENIGDLSPGESFSFNQNYQVTELDLCRPLVNNVTVNGTTTTGAEVESFSIETVEIVSNPAISVSKIANVTEARVGEVVGYTMWVNNTGDVALNSVMAYDNLTGHQETIGSLASGESFSFDQTYQVTEADLCKPLVNNVTASGTSTTGAKVESFSIETVEIASHPAISVSKTANVTEAEVGDMVGYTILVNNTGDVSLENVEAHDDLTGQTENIGTLAPGGCYSFSLSRQVAADDAGKVVVNRVTARGTSPCGDLVEGYDTASVNVEMVSNPAIAVNKMANVTEAGVGEVVGYTIWVNNTGDVALNSVTAYDNLTGHLENIGSLAPGESFSFDQAYKVAENNLCKPLVNNVTASGTSTTGVTVGSFSIETVEIASHPAIAVSKTANVTEAEVGDMVGYTIWVNNTGDVSLENVEAYDNLTDQTVDIGTLAAGDSYSFSLSRQMAADDAGKVVVNNVTVNGTSRCGILVSAFDTASVETIAVHMIPVAGFSANVTSGEAPLTVQFTDLSTNSPTTWFWDFGNDSTVDSTEQSPSYTYSTTGTYTVSLTVSNANGSDNEIKTDLISVSGSAIAPVANFTADKTSGVAPLTVSFTDLSSNSPTSWSWDFDNNGSVDSTQQNPSYTYSTAGTYTIKLVVSNAGGSDEEIKTDLVNVKGVSRPAIAVNKIANLTEAGAGAVISYTIWVNNTGGVALNSVTAYDDLTGHRENIGSLASGESFSFDQTYKVAEKDLCKPLVNRVSASGRATTGVRVENSSKKTVEMVSHPAIIVNKVASVTSASVGDVVGYTIWVNNTGDVSLKYVKAYDNQTGKIKNIGTLAPGSSYSFSLSHKVSAGDAGKVVVNKVTARGTAPCGDLVKGYGTASVTVKEASRPEIAVNKIANVTEAGLDDVVGYKIWVNNTGGVALNSVTAYDDLTGHRENIGSLASGESFSFDQTYKVAEKDLCKPLVNRVSASGRATTGVRVENSSKKTVEMVSHPAIIVNKVASVTSASVGDVVGYTIWVNNTGDVSLKYVKAYDNQTGKIKNIGTLAPGSNYSFSLSHKVSAGDAGKVIVNKVTARGTTPCGDLVKGYGTASVTVKEASHPATAENKTAKVTEAGSVDVVGNMTEMNNTDELGTINSASATNSSDDTSTVSASEVPEVHENPVDAKTTTDNETSTLPGVLLENNGTIRPDFGNDIQVDVVQQKDHLLSSDATIIPGDELPNEYSQESTEQSSSAASDIADATEDCATPVAENESAMLKNETNALLAQRNSTDEFLAD